MSGLFSRASLTAISVPVYSIGQEIFRNASQHVFSTNLPNNTAFHFGMGDNNAGWGGGVFFSGYDVVFIAIASQSPPNLGHWHWFWANLS